MRLNKGDKVLQAGQGVSGSGEAGSMERNIFSFNEYFLFLAMFFIYKYRVDYQKHHFYLY